MIAAFENDSEALPPDDQSLRQWAQRARQLYSRVANSGEPGRNKLLLKIRAFRARIWSMRHDSRQYRAQRAELDLSPPSEFLWKQPPAQLTNQPRHKLSFAIASTWDTWSPDAKQSPDPSGDTPTEVVQSKADAPRLREEVTSVVESSAILSWSKHSQKSGRHHAKKTTEELIHAQVAPLKAVHSIRLDPISAVVARLARPDSFQEAREVALKWLHNKRFKVSKALPESFELKGPAKGHRAVATGLPGVWAMQAEIADTTLEGRRWRVELVLVDAKPTPAVSVTLTAISLASHPAPAPSVPALVSSLIDEIGLLDVEAGEILSARPTEVDSLDELQRLLSSLQSPRRQRPAIVLSTYIKGGKTAHLLDPEMLARRLRGIAKVYVLSRRMSWALTDALSKRFAVAGASVRLFRPGFTPDDDPNRHPLWAPGILAAQDMSLNGLSSLLEKEAAYSSLRAIEQEDDEFPHFDRVREAVLRMQVDEARRQIANANAIDDLGASKALALQTALNDETKLREMFEEDNEAQRQEIQRLRRERDELIEEQLSWHAREYYLQGRVKSLEDTLADTGLVNQPQLPGDWNQLEDWCTENLGDAVAVTSKAIRAARASVFENVPFCYEVLLFLANTYVPSRKGLLPGGATTLEAEKDRLSIDISPVGRAAETHRSRETYSTNYKGVRLNLDMHVKGSNDRDPRNGFRLYFHWYEEEGRLIVGSFPGHLPNDMS